jgi:hypothetical protein
MPSLLSVVRGAVEKGAFRDATVHAALPRLVETVLGLRGPDAANCDDKNVERAMKSWEGSVLPKFRVALEKERQKGEEGHGGLKNIEGGKGVVGEGWNVEIVVVHDRGLFRL